MVSESEIYYSGHVLEDFQKMHVFKNIVFFRNGSKVLDRWSIPQSKSTTRITVWMISYWIWQRKSKPPEIGSAQKDWIRCIML